MLKEPLAEFFGVMFIILFGAGVDCQVVLSGNPAVASSPKGVSSPSFHHLHNPPQR